MSEKPNKKLSRRDAIKLLGAAAGASVLANLPTKWSKPSLASGVLPAHAQTTCQAVFVEVTKVELFDPISGFGGLTLIQGPLWDDLYIAGSGKHFVGTWVSWNCKEACLQLVFFAVQAGLSFRVTVWDREVFTFDVTSTKNKPDFEQFLVNLGTGEASLSVGTTPAGSCDWVAFPPLTKFDPARSISSQQ